ncbi:hypothetical protein LTR92_002262 [Exophiala xenobiotica]|nr:hypothetical protein LTR92_002262 [Exophiala xenobiotica]KAK5450934.1 hypothetical protein LTR18_000950 [Exophiala xenobiotica]
MADNTELGLEGLSPNSSDDAAGDATRAQDQEKQFWKTRIRCTLRLASAAGIEADIANVGATHPHFVRAFELAPNDFALVLPNFTDPGMSDNPTSRFFVLWDRHRDSPESIVIPIDGKSFCYTVVVQIEEYEYGSRTTKHLRAALHLTSAQVQDCQALVVCSLDDTDWVAFVPRFYYNMIGMEEAGGSMKLSLGTVPVAMARINPLPPVFAPFVMHKDNLRDAFDNMLSHVQNRQVKLRNPYSRLEYRPEASVQTRPFRAIFPQDNPELVLRYKIWKAFDDFAKVAGWTTQYRINNALCSPWTSDIRLDHKGGTSVLIELKEQHAKVSEDGQSLSHLQYALGGLSKGIFTFRAPWDYLFTMVTENVGYLILKEDIPTTFWHQDPGRDGWLTHRYGEEFLQHRRVDLSSTDTDIVFTIDRIVRGVRIPGDPPVQSRLTAKDIIELAGPCPVGLLVSEERMARLGLADDDRGADEDRTRRGGFAAHAVEDRFKRMGGLDATVDAQLFMPLMDQCRRVGKGCMVDLGKHHRFGRMAMVLWNWTEADKAQYDRTGRPPCWAGMLGSAVPMVVLCSQWARWRINYAPDEGTLGQVEHYRNAHPCIVVLSHFPKELGHLNVQRWVVPSEFMPMVQVGDLKAESRRAPLIMKQQHDIEQFIVPEADLHATVYQFLSREELIHVGLEQMAVNPRSYLKSIGAYKKVGESEFESCGNEEGQAWNRVTRQL